VTPRRVAAGLLDTTAVLLLPRIVDPDALPQEPRISTITLADLSVGPLVASSPPERAARLAHVQETEAAFEPIPFDAASARAFDALIAAVAVANDLPLYTCNPDDFRGIDGLDIVEIPHPDHA
jgi:tRNA(fMet)-specific endonuclease VapC